MGKLLFLIAAFIMVILFSGVVSAASTIYVNGTSGNDTYDGTSPLWVSGTIGPKKTIQNASNAVDTSGTVNVASGTYNEHITIAKSLSLIGANPATTIIDGTNNGRPLTITAPINVIIANFTIRNGATDYGGGIYNNEGTLTVINSILTGNNVNGNGGAIYDNNGTVTITNSTLTGNTALSSGGAIFKDNYGLLNISKSNLTGNTADTGGAIAIWYFSTVTITNSTLTGNTATFNGGAIVTSGTLTITNSTLAGNTALGSGAGIYNGYGTLTITNSTLTGNTCNFSGSAIHSETLDGSSTVTMHFNRVANNSPNAIYTNRVIDAEDNWWGSNSNPSTQFEGPGTVNYSPWIYMTLTASPTLILNGGTSTLTASFNNVYNGSVVTVINPASGHLPDGSVVTFTTDLGNVGSKTTNKMTSNGSATATLTANEGTGTAHVSAQLDNQTVNTAVGIETLYVNGATGNDTWDGTSPIFISGTTGPMKTIQTALNVIIAGGTVNVASGTYAEHLSINKNLNLIGANRDTTIIDGTHTGQVVYVAAADNVNIANFTIRNGATDYGGGIYSLAGLNINNCIITNNTASTGGGIYAAGTQTVNNSVITGNSAIYGGGIAYGWNTLNVKYSRLTNNTATYGKEIYQLSSSTILAQYNWWGQNTGPIAGQIEGMVTYSPWLYMNLTTSPTLILNGGTSTLTASFNYAYDGVTVISINPASGHLPDGSVVTFATDLGNVGSKTTIKNTSNGVATATLRADEGIGTANITALLDSQTVNTTVGITNVLYVNGATGNDDFDGLSPTFIGYHTGPMRTIARALEEKNSGGTINVASGIYSEVLTIIQNIKLIGNGTNNSIITPRTVTDNVITITSDVTEAMICGFTIQGATEGIGIVIQGNGVTVKDNNIFDNDRGITIGEHIEKAIISGNNIKYNNIGISTFSQGVKVNFNSIFENNVDIFTEVHGIDATYNWWGQNEAPNISGVITSPWLYMTLTAVPSEILDGQTSQIIASFNNVYEGDIVTPIDPADGHIQDNSPVTFTTDLGNVGSKTTIKNTINGTATATLSADETPGIAYITALFDKQELYADVKIIPARFVDGVNGNDLWDGSSPVWVSGLVGPMKTIQTAVNVVEASGVVSVASGTYNENIVVEKLVQIINDGSGIVTVRASNALLSVFLINPAGSGTIIQALNITGGSTGIYINGAGNCNLTGNNLTGNSWSGIGISGAQATVVENNNVSGNQEGIYILNGATNNRITGNTISGNQFSGVCVDTSYNTNISNNGLISGNSNGIRLYHATGNVVLGNNLPANLWCAIVLDGSSNNQITGSNTLTNNVEGIHLMNNANNNTINGTTIAGNSSSWCGMSVWGSTGNNLTNNSVSGNQEGIYLTQSASYNTVSQNNINNNLNSAICLDQNSQHNNIQNNTNITLNGNGIRLYQAIMNTITLNTITQSVWAAICLDNASSNNVSWNTASGNQEGIYIFNNANSNTIFYNTATNNAYSGICVNSATGNNLIGNTISLNGNGIRLYNYADNNNITSSTISQQGWAGIVIDSSHQNQIHYNNIQSNGEGLYNMNGSNNNYIYYNNFILNTNHNAYEDGTTNIYDDGSTGNYWSDYSGIGMYFIQIGNVDRHPV